MFDLKMQTEGRHVLLSVDNFSGHYIDYEPTNVEIDFFEPNLTFFIQPLDAGIICCFKAHYRKHFCQRAIKLDKAGERDIYTITLKESMKMAKEAWDDIIAEMIQCYARTSRSGCY
jgi:hypothetical protein